MDEIARAYVTLGVPSGAPLDAVRKSYKALVRKWHPDRFASDPQGQAEATLRMRAINDAFRAIAARHARVRASTSDAPGPGAPPPSTATPRSSGEFGRRLTREEIDRMVEAMKNDGPLDWILDATPPVDQDLGRKVQAGLLALAVGAVPALFAQAFAGRVPDGVILWTIVIVTVAGFAFFLRVLAKDDEHSFRNVSKE